MFAKLAYDMQTTRIEVRKKELRSGFLFIFMFGQFPPYSKGPSHRSEIIFKEHSYFCAYVTQNVTLKLSSYIFIYYECLAKST